MTTAVAPQLESAQEPQTQPIRELPAADRTGQQPGADELDATQGQQLGSHPYDDPTQGRQIGFHPYDDATQAR
jgi:hypothetical protein